MRAAGEGDPAWKREGAGQEKTETRRRERMREPPYFAHEEYHLARELLSPARMFQPRPSPSTL